MSWIVVNPQSEASGFITDWLLTDELREQARSWETGTGDESEDLILDRGARIMQALLEEIERLEEVEKSRNRLLGLGKR